MQIDKSWKTNKLFTDDRTSNLEAYLEGASDFQKKAIEELQKEYDFVELLIEKSCFQFSMNIIKNLKPN